jgi:hypothetical protein
MLKMHLLCLLVAELACYSPWMLKRVREGIQASDSPLDIPRRFKNLKTNGANIAII